MGKLLIKHDPKKLLPLEYGRISVDGMNIFIDPDQWGWIIQCRWKIKYNHNTPYAIRKVQRKGKSITLRMHREIMNTPEGYDCHHLNKNTLDNRKINLKNCTKTEHRIIQRTLF